MCCNCQFVAEAEFFSAGFKNYNKLRPRLPPVSEEISESQWQRIFLAARREEREVRGRKSI